jgi:thiol-disulfide isomerase/thioredoxin
MRCSLLLGAILLVVNANAQTPAGKLWSDLKAKRDALPGLHQEFELSQTVKTSTNTQNQKENITLDMSHEKWRERIVSGAGDHQRIYDGTDELYMEDGGDEFVRVKHKAKDGPPEPALYNSMDYEWAKGSEKDAQPCGLSGPPRTCVIIDVPIKASIRPDSNGRMTKEDQGIARFLMDVDTGMVVMLETEEVIETPNISYNFVRTYTLKKMGYGSGLDASLFKLPDGNLREVRSLTPWDAPRIKKLLVGKPAPELEVEDIHGNPISLASLKGKTVLLDFWTTWCPPCRADAPSLEKLYEKYGGKNLMIVGISVSEDRKIVEDYLKKNVHSYPVVLTSENEMPRTYQLGIFPTYIVISPDGTVAAAMQGDQGFGELRSVLKKAAMDTD